MKRNKRLEFIILRKIQKTFFRDSLTNHRAKWVKIFLVPIK